MDFTPIHNVHHTLPYVDCISSICGLCEKFETIGQRYEANERIELHPPVYGHDVAKPLEGIVFRNGVLTFLISGGECGVTAKTIIATVELLVRVTEFVTHPGLKTELAQIFTQALETLVHYNRAATAILKNKYRERDIPVHDALIPRWFEDGEVRCAHHVYANESDVAVYFFGALGEKIIRLSSLTPIEQFRILSLLDFRHIPTPVR